MFLRKKEKPRPPPTKAKLAARERKKALKARKSIYEQEKMPLDKAVNILRVSCFDSQISFMVSPPNTNDPRPSRLLAPIRRTS